MKVIYIIAQILSISSVFCMLLFIKSLYDKRKYGLFYSLMRGAFHRDCSKLAWYMKNKIYFYYLSMGVGMIMILLNLLNQITTGAFKHKSITLSVGLIVVSLFNIKVITELIKKIKR